MEILWFILKVIGVIIGLIILGVIFYFKGKLESYSEWYNEHEVDK